MSKDQTLEGAAIIVLTANTPLSKVTAAHELARLWNAGELKLASDTLAPPQYPGRPQNPELVPPSELPRRRLGSVHGRVALLHAIAHIEFNAINLAADMTARFAQSPRIADEDRQAFISDWVGVCDDEARHFTMIMDRLIELDANYGDLPAHDGLWSAALSTKDDLAARLAVAPMVLEARGLDVTPSMITKLTSANDKKSADILSIIYQEEIGHVAAGTRWFTHICTKESRNPKDCFTALVKLHFKGPIKPPFNIEARERAGLPLAFYQS